MPSTLARAILPAPASQFIVRSSQQPALPSSYCSPGFSRSASGLFVRSSGFASRLRSSPSGFGFPVLHSLGKERPPFGLRLRSEEQPLLRSSQLSEPFGALAKNGLPHSAGRPAHAHPVPSKSTATALFQPNSGISVLRSLGEQGNPSRKAAPTTANHRQPPPTPPSPFHIPHSTFRIPHSTFRIPHSSFFSHSVSQASHRWMHF